MSNHHLPSSSSSSSSSSSPLVLLPQLMACFAEDPDIDEYDFVLLPPPSEDTPDSPPFLLQEHKLAIATWALKLLFKEAHTIFTSRSSSASPSLLLQATQTLLLVNPDMYTAWNLRKKLLLSQPEILTERQELQFLDLVFSKHTKKGSAWAHRRWCLARLLLPPRREKEDENDHGKQPSQPPPPATHSLLFEHEYTLSARIAEVTPKNYYAWTHRWWVVQQEQQLQHTLTDREREVKLLEQVRFAEAWINKHAWDMSAINFLHQCLAARLSQCVFSSAIETYDSFLCLLEDVLKRNATQLDQYPGHESLWLQRRGLVELWVEASVCMSMKEGTKERKREEEVEMARHYLEEEGPRDRKEGREGEGQPLPLLWDETAIAKQRIYAWAHKCWAWMKMGDSNNEKVRDALQHELAVLEEGISKGGGLWIVPWGYKHLG